MFGQCKPTKESTAINHTPTQHTDTAVGGKKSDTVKDFKEKINVKQHNYNMTNFRQNIQLGTRLFSILSALLEKR